MSFHLIASTSQPQSNQINYDSSSVNFAGFNEENGEFNSIDANKFVKFPKITMDHHNQFDKTTEMCFDYEKCFANQFQYDANNFAYTDENPFNLTATSTTTTTASTSIQPYGTNQFTYEFNAEPHQLQNQMGMCELINNIVI